MKYIGSIKQLAEATQSFRAIILIFVDPANLPPSNSLVKLFTNHLIAQKFTDNIYVVQIPNAQLYTHFKVFQFPVVFLLRKQQILYSFIGCNQQRTIQVLNRLCDELGKKRPSKKIKIGVRLCPQKHEMQIISMINQALYRKGVIICNICNMYSHVEKQKPVLHCPQCYYDVCSQCAYQEVFDVEK